MRRHQGFLRKILADDCSERQEEFRWGDGGVSV